MTVWYFEEGGHEISSSNFAKYDPRFEMFSFLLQCCALKFIILLQTFVISASECNPIQLSIFAHRFMSIAEQMGRTLQVIRRGWCGN